ncbi:MAG: tRNA pseudouridine(55) synthase TruB [Planctomycetes bacterium]|nr:tRNA pseudouridine(55) synthase TruB [Planctomycetota bacterium]
MPAQSFHGLLILDKPLGMTSRDAVNRAWRWFPRGTRIGHTGTLDPLASGVLVLCIGAATRLAEYVQRMQKVYHAGIRLGVKSDTDDAEGTLSEVHVETPPTRAGIDLVLRAFIGEIDQVPPAFSAAKVTGKRAYELARKGKEVNLSPRRVQIDAIDVLSYAYPHLEIEVRCGKGTYIRSLARDIGQRLNTGAVLTSLRRTRVGHFQAENAVPLDADTETARSRLLPMIEAVRDLPRVVLPEEMLARLRNGQAVPYPQGDPFLEPRPLGSETPVETAVVSNAGELVAIVQIDPVKGVVLPDRVLPGDSE